MTVVSITQASGIYRCGQQNDPRLHAVKYGDLEQFAKDLRQFEFSLGDGHEVEFWGLFVRKLRSFRFEMCAAPLGQAYRERQFSPILTHLKSELKIYGQAKSALVPSATRLLGQTEALIRSLEIPVAAKLVELIGDGESAGTALILCESRLVGPTHEVLRAYPKLQGLHVMGQAEARSNVCYERIIALGARRWYQDYVFTAPRAVLVDVVGFSWLGDRWRPAHRFATAAKAKEDAEPELHQRLTVIEADEIVPHIDLFDAFKRAKGQNPVSGGHEDVKAVGLLLSDGLGVYLDAEEGARSLVIDLTESQGDEVQRVPVGEIEPGMYVLLRSGGGGDYIVEAADVILGKRSQKLRHVQKTWKNKLRKLVEEEGVDKVVKRLKREGSSVASEPNVRNWMSYRSIKTQKPADFRAIMVIIGKADLADSLWKHMSFISRAHRKAGNTIRRLLVAQVKEADLRELARLGRMDFELTGTGARALTAYRIENIDRSEVQVPAHRLGHAFRVEE